MTRHAAHIGGPAATALLAILARDFGITAETAVRDGGATGDFDGPGERVIAAADLEAMADEAEARETRWRERGWR